MKLSTNAWQKTYPIILFGLIMYLLYGSQLTYAAQEEWLSGFSATASSYVSPFSPDLVSDGSLDPLSRWYCGKSSKYLILDLGGLHNLSGWRVYGLGTAGWDASSNLKSYSLEVSMNGSTWTPVDTVTNNTANDTERSFPNVEANYVRLNITAGNQNNNYWASVLELELYGVAVERITDSMVRGVTEPEIGNTPVYAIDNDTFTGTVTWSGNPTVFEPGTSYTASIVLTPKTGYTLTGVGDNFFVALPANTSYNAATHTVTAIFEPTDSTISNTTLSGLTAPAIGATPMTSFDNEQFIAVVAWDGAPTAFAANTAYTAEITLTPKAGYTLVGIAENAFTISGATTTNSANSGVIQASFPAMSITYVGPVAITDITGVANGVEKSESGLGLPSQVQILTSAGPMLADLDWDVNTCAYDVTDTNAQNFTVAGTILLPAGVQNPMGLPLQLSIQVGVNASAVDESIISIASLSDISGIENGVTKSVAGLGLPNTVEITTSSRTLEAQIAWDVAGCTYDTSYMNSQTFTVNGEVVLPDGIVNTNSISLSVSVEVTVDMLIMPEEEKLVNVSSLSNISGLDIGVEKTVAGLNLPSTVSILTSVRILDADIVWDLDGCTYDASSLTNQTFTVTGEIVLPSDVVNPDGVSLSVTVQVSVDDGAITPGAEILVSITMPDAIRDIENGTAKTASALGLPTTVTMNTDYDSIPAAVTWSVSDSAYDPSEITEQTVTIYGTVSLPSYIENPNNVSLYASIEITVSGITVIPVTEDLVSLETLTPISGIPNGAPKTVAGLGLPTTLEMQTSTQVRTVAITWDLDSIAYNPIYLNAQTFLVYGTVTLPDGVLNTNGVSLTIVVRVTVDNTLIPPEVSALLNSVTSPASITGLTNGTAKTAAALGLPSTVELITDMGSIDAFVAWDVDASSYDTSKTTAQTFNVTGLIALPSNVVNDNNLSLEVNISVSVKAKTSSSNNGNTTGGTSAGGTSAGGTSGGSTASADSGVTSSTTGDGTAAVTTSSTSVSGTTSGGITSAQLSESVVNRFISSATSAETAGGKAVVDIALTSEVGSTGARLSIPSSAFNGLAENTNAELQITTAIGSLSFDSTALDSINSAAAGDVSINVSMVDTAALPSGVSENIGNRPVYSFSVTSAGESISSFGNGSVRVSLPYTLQEGEDPNAVVVYYINAAGGLETMQGAYNSQTGSVSFTTTHFSEYVIGYNEVDFKDVTDSDWYCDAVTYLAARGVVSGTSAETYAPDATLTRGQFVTMLLKAYGIKPMENAETNFADAGDMYYTEYLATAKAMGIVSGIGDNLYAPEQSITREAMATMIYKALQTLDEVFTVEALDYLDAFTDTAEISSWSTEAMCSLVDAGIISGSNGELKPKDTACRCEMAQILYNLLAE